MKTEKHDWSCEIDGQQCVVIEKVDRWFKLKPITSGTVIGIHVGNLSGDSYAHLDTYNNQHETEIKMHASNFTIDSFVTGPMQQWVCTSGALASFTIPLQEGISHLTLTSSPGSLGIRADKSGHVAIINIYGWKDL